MATDDYVTCPYDPSHRILKSRMSRHLIKCELNHPTLRLLTCPYNKIHRISPLEYEHHLSICESKGTVQRNYFENASSISANILPVTKINELQIPPSSENWDEEPEPSQSYLQNLEKKNEDFPLAAATKLKKKQLKLKEQDYFAVNVASTSPLRPKTLKLTDEENRTTPIEDTTIVKSSKSKDASILELSPSKDAPIVELSTSSDTEIKDNGTIKTPKKTTAECSPDRLRNDKDIKKNFSIGRGIFKICEIHRKFGISKKNFESKFMNSKSDVESLVKQSAEMNNNKGIFVGYSEDDFTLDMDNIENKLTDIDV
ncbi:gametocyte-specific factor 1-like [Vespa mandarinia]|uniref:gametocyte-specific factor 1-like n=1 Tax=Vespa mandarinia TaxID=7446 RepID=UPI00161DC036|nr:gametocyte-specific factor 1-like [Vespa mandarinia]